jgi:DNA recombination protein RmuC
LDAALFVGNKILCIDAKFPLENFRRTFQCESEEERKNARKVFLSDVKKHVNTIAEKYILPDEDTFDFALMYIPAENVYYELIVKEESNLFEHCLAKKVIPVSPNTFYAYLQVIVMGLRGFQISEQAKVILAQIQQMRNDLERFESDFGKIGSHLRDAEKSFDRSQERFRKLKDKVATMGSTSLESDMPALESEIPKAELE